MAKSSRNDEPRRVESPARMAVAEEASAPRESAMKVAEDPVVPKDVIELRHPDGRVDAIVNLGVGPGYVGEPSDGMVTDCILEIEASVIEQNPYHPIDAKRERDMSEDRPKVEITIWKDGVLERTTLEAPFWISGNILAQRSIFRQLMGGASGLESGWSVVRIIGDDEQMMAEATAQRIRREDSILARAEVIRAARDAERRSAGDPVVLRVPIGFGDA